ncbi:MAG: hypothetical protein PHF33_05075 [Candidatus Delongbacteria bacterium]|nr:hypothetical protein [Candidatus Delongbacteria bacterium]MDD4205754.1 hypothetical protein [Candidatus Delongbacteria bacterium]
MKIEGDDKMEFWKLVGKVIQSAASSTIRGSASLKDAYLNQKAPIGTGVYKVYHRGQLMKVGKAVDGLRKRFSDYYRGKEGGTAGLKFITSENRDHVRVTWLECPSDKCRELETQWHDKARTSGEEMPWSERR